MTLAKDHLREAEESRLGLDSIRALAQIMKDFDLGELELHRPSGENLRLVRERRSATQPGTAGATDSSMPALPGDLPAEIRGGVLPPPPPGSLTGATSAGVTGAAQAGISIVASSARDPLGRSADEGMASTEMRSPTQNLFVVSAPLVGTFYRATSPDALPFVEIGQRIRKGQTMCIIEAMKLMNELESEVDGVVVACLADNGRPVEYGQPLYHISRG